MRSFRFRRFRHPGLPTCCFQRSAVACKAAAKKCFQTWAVWHWHSKAPSLPIFKYRTARYCDQRKKRSARLLKARTTSFKAEQAVIRHFLARCIICPLAIHAPCGCSLRQAAVFADGIVQPLFATASKYLAHILWRLFPAPCPIASPRPENPSGKAVMPIRNHIDAGAILRLIFSNATLGRSMKAGDRPLPLPPCATAAGVNKGSIAAGSCIVA